MTTATAGQPVKRLDWREKQKVRYAVPLWLRDEQIKVACATVRDRIAPRYDVRPEPVAVVCYGPSLAETWERVTDCPVIITCSGAHKFLLERDIVPTYHVEVDPRAHKIQLLGAPHPAVEYLPASTCHPAYLDHLLQSGATVKLWHVFDSQEDARRTLPAGEWALTGGSSVGLRALTIAAFLGFRDLHVFGMDGCEGPTGKHAADHPNQPPGYSETEYEGVTYRTTASMLECARQTWHELDQMPGVTATFYGEGLVQAMARRYVPKVYAAERPALVGAIAARKPELISPEYAALNARLHRDNLAYGVGAGKYAPTILKLAETLKTTSVLDYGAGKGYLAKALPFPIWEYDPAFPEKAESPRPADLVACLDTLEHIEPDKIVVVLDDLRRCVKRLGYFVIHTGPSSKTLADGRNAHVLQRDRAWWERILGKFFRVGTIQARPPLLHVVVAPKGQATVSA